MKLQLNKINYIAILTRIAGLGVLAGDAGFQSSISSVAGTHAPQIVAGIGLASFLATDILNAVQHTNASAPPPPGTANVIGISNVTPSAVVPSNVVG